MLCEVPKPYPNFFPYTIRCHCNATSHPHKFTTFILISKPKIFWSCKHLAKYLTYIYFSKLEVRLLISLNCSIKKCRRVITHRHYHIYELNFTMIKVRMFSNLNQIVVLLKKIYYLNR